MKRIFTGVFALILIFTTFLNTVLAIGNMKSDCNVYITVAPNSDVRYNSADTYEISFDLQSDSIKLKGPQNCSFAVDLSVFDLLDKKGNILTDTLSTTYLSVGNKTVYTTADVGDIVWSAAAYYAVSADEKTAFISLQPYQLDGEQDISCEITLESILVGLKNGKNESDITEESVRLITTEEARELCQDAITLSDGTNVYIRGSIVGGRESNVINSGVKWRLAVNSHDENEGTHEIVYAYTAEEDEQKWTNPFTDICESDDYYDAVQFVYENELFVGVSDTEFAPHKTMTRAMFVTVLGRLAGVDQMQYAGSSFNDAVEGSWYSAYVEWAAENGIVNGYGNGRFGVNDKVTIEQATAIIARYARFTGIDTGGKYLAEYGDIMDISEWAIDDMAWAVDCGVYAGNGGLLTPKAKAERALVATMMYGFVENFLE